MNKKYNFAFEVSDNIAQHGHMLPLLHECCNDTSILVTLYTNKKENILILKKQYLECYQCELPANVDIYLFKDNRLNILKRKTLSLINILHIHKVTPIIRKLFLKLKSANTTEDYSLHYKKNSNFFLSQNVVLTTELKGSPWLLDSPVKLVWLLHGIISNDNPYFKDWQCDIVVSPQVNLEDKLKERIKIPKNTIFYKNAYLKKEIINSYKNKEKLFHNDNPIVVYNPHWDNGLNQSSWFNYGLDILKFFKENNQFNLIFAPHLLLDKFYKISIPQEYIDTPNIIIDLSSPNLINGTYVGHADYYLGDVSSQFFEFALCNTKIRPIFINCSKMDWKSKPIYSYWNTGLVINNIDELHFAIENATPNEDGFIEFFHHIPDNQSKILLDFLKKNI
ncbi:MULTISPECIES: hypothetical protein [Providencia]|uniref:hypothetical protein n=2 Tax=Morganellaceae TaxID=1903414 RepID=UPI001981771C|nr:MULTISPECIES: hypothetical protein [Providencia]MBN4866504.1 hypothetical protein [Providencia stuartii]MBN4875826.1 hypothetical protein [Providencia stuartii]MBN4880518.1 hypothetical protein [Providencia stuartii]MBN4885026.1 hypothetical protein [Providencia stuartii]